MALSKALHFSQTGVQCHGRVIGVLSHVEVRSPPKLLLYHQGLLQQLGGTGEQGFGTDSGLHQCKPVSHWKLQLPAILPPPPRPQQAPGESQSRPSHTPSIPERDLGSTSIALQLSGAGTAPSPLPGTSPDWPAWSHHPPEPLSAPPLPALPLGQCLGAPLSTTSVLQNTQPPPALLPSAFWLHPHCRGSAVPLLRTRQPWSCDLP